MLALTRKVKQKITIADNIEITVVSVSNETVKLAIKAPKDMPIIRDDTKRRFKCSGGCKECKCQKSKQCIADAVDIMMQIMGGNLPEETHSAMWKKVELLLSQYGELKSQCCKFSKEAKNV